MSVIGQGILRFPERWGINHGFARDVISDHVPVWIALKGASLRLLDNATVVASSETNACIDINSAPADELNDLPHVGESRAAAIVEGWPWASLDALAAVSGLSDSRVEDIASSGLGCNH
ncbi:MULTISPECIES: ComEA family DNA-binding protein [Halomonadaceae]|uniref:Helix-hairpin-helix domain-containing protein n=1 Tax=Halomonas casei TaxID=2742613 RepID=A0ABR9F4G9_9GAMM|nr:MULTISPECIES: helix-hairpin-helix domain-containing protein [Halomonas]MBE0401358.1 helix-hairpin-helix domain-containing protein [Halomonas casei]WKD30473.1 helix-hairpin-helix domain-containing protein [Halomonas sp. KG2]